MVLPAAVAAGALKPVIDSAATANAAAIFNERDLFIFRPFDGSLRFTENHFQQPIGPKSL